MNPLTVGDTVLIDADPARSRCTRPDCPGVNRGDRGKVIRVGSCGRLYMVMVGDHREGFLRSELIAVPAEAMA